MMDKLVQIFCVAFLAVEVYGAAPACIGPAGSAVDWYAAYKMPKVKGTTWNLMQSGAALVYLDPKNPAKWHRLDKMINDSSSIFGTTIAPIFHEQTKHKLLWLLYNDQPPPTRESPYYSGHAKGLIIFNEEGGLWLVHSVPGFPSRPNFERVYQYPSSGHLNGQSILCMSFPISELPKIAQQLYYNKIVIYDSNYPANVVAHGGQYMNLLMDPNAKRPGVPYYSTMDLKTAGGVTFRSFAKDSRFSKDLFADLISLDLQTGLKVEGWRGGNETSNMPAACGVQFHVNNVQSISFDAGQDLDQTIQFANKIDHSKWAISIDANKPWVCSGDINRQFGQKSRGGGMVCLKNKYVWSAYNGLVDQVDKCA